MANKFVKILKTEMGPFFGGYFVFSTPPRLRVFCVFRGPFNSLFRLKAVSEHKRP